jgi:DNA-binding MarR family transcriptional regulator
VSAEHDRLARQAWRPLRGILESHFQATGASAQALGLSPVMGHFLRTLLALPTGPMTQLVDHLGVDAAWVTAVVDRLETRGDVVRVPSPVDRRVKLLEVTEGGRATWRKLQRIIATPPPQLKQLAREDLEALVRIGEQLSTIAEAEPVEPTPKSSGSGRRQRLRGAASGTR